MARPEVTGRRSGDTAVAAKRTAKSATDKSIEIDPAVSDEIEPFAPAEVASVQTIAQPVARGPPKLAFSIAEFCAAHNISQAFYFELQKIGQGPRVMRVGARRLISIEDAARWRDARAAA